jgi:hypothetical protein
LETLPPRERSPTDRAVTVVVRLALSLNRREVEAVQDAANLAIPMDARARCHVAL